MKVKTQGVSSLIDDHSSCLEFTSFNVPPVWSLKQPINYCCRICTILFMTLKKCLFKGALWRPSFM